MLSNMNNCEKKKDIKFKKNNDNKPASIILKTVTNNQDNDKYISSSEIKELKNNSNMEQLKKYFWYFKILW